MSQPPNTRSSSPTSGTTSLIFGERPSVRLPSRIVPICVSEPIGDDNPLRMANTPAIVVVLTAPRPTSNTPSLPRAGAISIGVGTNVNYISHQSSVASLQSPVFSHQSSVTSLQSPVFSRQSSVTSLQSPVFSRQSSVASLQSPVFSRQSSVAS